MESAGANTLVLLQVNLDDYRLPTLETGHTTFHFGRKTAIACKDNPEEYESRRDPLSTFW